MSPKTQIYLDNNAGTLVDPRVLAVVLEGLTEVYGNSSSIHQLGQQARHKLSKARQAIATSLRVKPSEIIFTSGGSEGASFALKGILAGQPPGHIISSNLEHACVYETLRHIQTQGHQVSFLSSEANGVLPPELVQSALRPNTRLIALMAVNNETGAKTDIQAIASIAKEANIPFVVDGVALLGKDVFTIPEGVSAMFFSGHKIHAPKGVGFTFIRSKVKVTPLIMGGEQEFGHRAGSENVPGIMGLAEAIRLAQVELPEAIQRMQSLRDHFENSLLSALSDVKINGTGPRVCNTSNLCFRGVEGETLLAALDLAGVAASHGSACASGALEPSRVLLNMGLPPVEAASSLRFSLSRLTTQAEIDQCIEIVISLVKRLR